MNGKSTLHGALRHLPSPQLLHEFFDCKVREEGPEARRNGIFFEGEFLSYVQLQQASTAIASNLRQYVKSSQSTIVVAVDLQPCNELVACLIGVLKAGAAFLPVDSQSAVNRVRKILNEVKPICIVTDSTSSFIQDADTVWSQFRIIDVAMLLRSKYHSETHVKDQPHAEKMDRKGPNTVAAIVYTSGSTGHPKGVMLSHKSVMNRLGWQWLDIPFDEDEVCCFKTSLLFVDSIVEVFSAVMQLKPLVIVKKTTVHDPEEFVNLLVAHQVTRLTTVPSLLRNLLFYLAVSGRATDLAKLKIWISNSEMLRYGLAKTFFQVFQQSKTLYNLYGSTESMADITFEQYRDLNDLDKKRIGDSLSIGKPLHNSSLHIIDENLRIVRRGEVGQIALTGYNIALGYINSSEELEFMPNPFPQSEGHPVLYLSGDFGRIMDGRVIFEGRRDSQVKIRGQRVNIMEVEKVIDTCPYVTWTHIMCHQFSDTSQVIVAYYIIAGNIKRTKVESDIMQRCQEGLPSYMRPKLVQISEVPLQPHSDKIDRVKLRKAYEKNFNRQSSQELALVDEKARKVVNILALNLNIPTAAISLRKSFFDLGGNSVNMVASIVQLQDHGLHISIEEFSRTRTVNELIERIRSRVDHSVRKELSIEPYSIVPLRKIKDLEEVERMFTESFVHKEPLDVLLGVTCEEFQTFARSLCRAATRDVLSFIVVDNCTGCKVAGDFLFSYLQAVRVEHHQSMAPILSLMKEFEDPVREKLAKSSRSLLYNYCLCVERDLAHSEQVRLCHLIEENVIKIANENGFHGIVTNNTNPVTQDICQYFFGYEVMSSFHVKEFVFNGRKVFSHAPDDYCIKMMLKLF